MTKKQEELNPRIRRARVDSLDLYEITEDELATLEQGLPGSLYLLFSTFLLSMAVSFLITLLVTKIESDRLYIIFVVVTVIGFISGIVLLFLWIKAYRSSIPVSHKIRERMKDETKNEELKQKVTDPTSTLGTNSKVQS